MERLFLSFVALVPLTGPITTCGQKSPLHLPDDEKAKKKYSKDHYGF